MVVVASRESGEAPRQAASCSNASGGLARFDPATETFTRFSFRDDSDDPAHDIVTVILEDH